MPQRESRARVAEVRAVTDDDGPAVRLRLIRPHVVDDYGSVWMPHSLDEGLAQRLPTLAWGHDWTEPLGRGVDYWPSDDGPEVLFAFDDFNDVPMARRAYSQVRSGTITDCSVGFYVPDGGRRAPTAEEVERWPGVREVIERAVVDEVSLVLRGAVPGARVLAVRSPHVTVDQAVELARRVQAGEISREEAQEALALLGQPDTPTEPPASSGDEPGDDDGGDGDPDLPPAAEVPVEDIDAALALVAERSRIR